MPTRGFRFDSGVAVRYVLSGRITAFGFQGRAGRIQISG